MNRAPVREMPSRKSILEKLRASVERRQPVVAAGASAGLIAKCAEAGGADLIVVYSTGRSRLMGLPTTELGDSNQETLNMLEEIANVTEHAPIIGGVKATDPRYLQLRRLVETFRLAGFAGLINFPTVGSSPHVARARAGVGLGFEREVEAVRIAREMDIFTMAYVFDCEQARQMADAGVDVLVAHVGWTSGGLVGAKETLSTEEALSVVRDILEAGHTGRDGPLGLAHGGPLEAPADTVRLYDETSAVGFVGASSIERIPVERAVLEAVRSFKGVAMTRKRIEYEGGRDGVV